MATSVLINQKSEFFQFQFSLAQSLELSSAPGYGALNTEMPVRLDGALFEACSSQINLFVRGVHSKETGDGGKQHEAYSASLAAPQNYFRPQKRNEREAIVMRKSTTEN
jgi:hypothetical protein